MKSMYFRNLAKGLVIVSAALALVNCNDTTAAAEDAISDAQQQYQDLNNPNVDPNNPNGGVVDPNAGQQDPNGGQLDPNNPNGGQVDPNGGQLDPNNPNGGQVDPNGGSLNDPNGGSGNQNADATVTESSSSQAAVGLTSSSSESLTEVSSSSEEKVEGGIFLATDTDENKDYMEVEYIKDTGWDGGGILAYPKRLSENKKHAVVMWGPGGGTNPDAYGGLIRRLASHGFVVIALKESPGNTTQGKPALDWLAGKNNDPSSPLYQKLDMTKVGCSGHSMGGLESEQMLINDDRVITAIMNNSGDLGHTAMSKVPQGKTIAIVYGEGGMERPNAEADYNNQGVKAPACLIKMTGGQGNECQQGECGWGHGSGPWGGMAATVAWMRWHLGGEDFRKADFVGTSGKYINGSIIGEQGNWKGQCKNF